MGFPSASVFGIRYDVIRRTENGDVSSLVFGKPGHDDFFLLVLIARGDDVGDRPSGTSTIGLLVDELDAAHTHAVTAGGTELVAPHNPDGMPRCSAVADPSGNRVWLYHKQPTHVRKRPSHDARGLGRCSPRAEGSVQAGWLASPLSF